MLHHEESLEKPLYDLANPPPIFRQTLPPTFCLTSPFMKEGFELCKDY